MQKGNKAKNCRNFFSTKYGIKSRFWLEGVSIRKCIFITLVSYQLKHCHELINGFTIYDTLITMLRIQIKLASNWIHDAACQIIVLHGGSFDYLLIIGHPGHSVNCCTGKLMLHFQPEHPYHLENRRYF